MESQNRFMLRMHSGFKNVGTWMRTADFSKTGRFAAIRRLIIFNCAAIVGFVLGTVAFTVSMFLYPNPTIAWLSGNLVGGLSHFTANFVMQGQSKNEVAKCFIVFNATGIVSFLIASVMFAVAIIFVQDSTASWLSGSIVGTLSHFVMNDRGMRLNITFKRRSKECQNQPIPGA